MKDQWILKVVTPFGYKHPQLVAVIRVAIGALLLVQTANLYGSGSRGGWEVVLLLLAALCFYLAYREPRAIRATKNAADAT